MVNMVDTNRITQYIPLPMSPYGGPYHAFAPPWLLHQPWSTPPDHLALSWLARSLLLEGDHGLQAGPRPKPRSRIPLDGKIVYSGWRLDDFRTYSCCKHDLAVVGSPRPSFWPPERMDVIVELQLQWLHHLPCNLFDVFHGPGCCGCHLERLCDLSEEFSYARHVGSLYKRGRSQEDKVIVIEPLGVLCLRR